ncbi:unnamed protein product [Leptosia nina]|uniref:Peptidase S1 domain-containing protein n=1 Tax=Leptosia nina TaxID=320188 RepID=A0AAV1ISQ7_9NEOP
MGKIVVTLLLSLSAALATSPQARIAGGSAAVINSYPFAVALLRSQDYVSFAQVCAGSIITTRSVLTAASCFL